MGSHGQRRRSRRDFWRAWRDEQRQRWREQHPGEDTPPEADPPADWPPFPPGARARAWREYFHRQMGVWPEDHWAFGGRRFTPWHQGQDAFNPFVASLLSKGSGLLPVLVLQLLSEQPRYGNALMELLQERTGGQWAANPGAIYPLMTMLEKRGLVVGQWDDPTKRTIRIYHLTEAGAQELTRLKAIIRPKLEEAVEVLQQFSRDLNGDPPDNPIV